MNPSSKSSGQSALALSGTILAAVLIAAGGVNAFDCTSYSGHSDLHQELATTVSGVNIGPVKGNIAVKPLEDNKCKLDFNLDTSSALSVENLVWFERPSSNTDYGKKIECKVSKGMHSCVVPNTGAESGVDSLALYDESTKSVYATANFSSGGKKVQANHAAPHHAEGNGTHAPAPKGNETHAPAPKGNETHAPAPKGNETHAPAPKGNETHAPDAKGAEHAKKPNGSVAHAPGGPTPPGVITYYPTDGTPPYVCVPRDKNPESQGETPALPPVGGAAPPQKPKAPEENGPSPTLPPLPIGKNGTNPTSSPLDADKDIFSGSFSTTSHLGYVSISAIFGAIILAAAM